MGWVMHVNCPQSVQIDGIPHHMKDLHPFMGLKPSYGCDSDSEESEWLVNMGLTVLGESDASPDDGLSEYEMTLQDNFLNSSGQNALWLDDLIVRLKTRFTSFPFGEVPGARGLLLAVVFVIMISERSVAKGEMNYLVILSDSVCVLLSDVQ